MRRINRLYLKLDHNVLIDLEVYQYLVGHQLRADFNKSECEYPVIRDSNGTLIDYLHPYTYGFVNGVEELRDGKHHVHHKDLNKKNCRVENLELLLPADHARKHILIRRKKQEQHDVYGLWRPHEKRPLELIDPDAPLLGQVGKTARESYSPPEEWTDTGSGRPSLGTQLRHAESILEEAFDVLDSETRHLDSGTPIPKTITPGSSVDRKSKAVGLNPIRLGCTRSEAALVRLLVKHKKPDGGFDTTAAGAEVGIAPALLPHFMKRPSVAVAVERWQRYRRLPKVATASWPRRRTG